MLSASSAVSAFLLLLLLLLLLHYVLLVGPARCFIFYSNSSAKALWWWMLLYRTLRKVTCASVGVYSGIMYGMCEVCITSSSGGFRLGGSDPVCCILTWCRPPVDRCTTVWVCHVCIKNFFFIFRLMRYTDVCFFTLGRSVSA